MEATIICKLLHIISASKAFYIELTCILYDQESYMKFY